MLKETPIFSQTARAGPFSGVNTCKYTKHKVLTLLADTIIHVVEIGKGTSLIPS